MTQEQAYSTLLGLANNLQDTVYSDATHQTIIFDIGQNCHVTNQSNQQLDVLASQTLEKLKAQAEELSSLAANLSQLPTAQQIHAPDVQSLRNDIFVTAVNGVSALVSFITLVQEFNEYYEDLDNAPVPPGAVNQIRKIKQSFNYIKEYLRKN